MSTPPKDPNRKRVTLTKLAEMRALGEPIVMITAYDHPSALDRRGGGRRRRPGRRQRRQQRARLLGHRPGDGRGAADAHARRPARPQDAAAGRRPAVRLLRGQRRAGDRDRAPLRQGGGLRRGQARGRRRLRRARPRDRARRRAGDGSRRVDAADGDDARRLPRPGPHRGARPPGARRRARAAGGGLLLDRLRGDPQRRDRRDHALHGDPDHRDRRRARAPTARCWCCTTC